MTGMDHGHMDGEMNHAMPHLDGPCEHSEMQNFIDTHQMESDSAQLEETNCSLCALCASIVLEMDVNFKFVGESFSGYGFDVTSFPSKSLRRLDRPPRA